MVHTKHQLLHNLHDTVVVFSVAGSPSPIKFVAVTENVYMAPGIKLLKVTIVSSYTVSAAGHLDLLVHKIV